MSVDQRLRTGLAANTAQLRPNLDHELGVLRRRVHRRRRVRRIGVGGAAIAAIVAGVVWLPGALDAVNGAGRVTDPAIEQNEAVPSATPLVPPQAIGPGRYAMAPIGSGATEMPSAVIAVASDEYSHDGMFLRSRSGSVARAISIWTVTEVAADPCSGDGREWVDPGPTVADLAAALAAQPLKNGTDPVAVSLAGYQGLYVETSAAFGVAIEDCVDESFVSWRSDDGKVRVHGEGGEVGRLWILDVDGNRLIVDVTHSPDASFDQIAELTHIIESITFEQPGEPSQS